VWYTIELIDDTIGLRHTDVWYTIELIDDTIGRSGIGSMII
jgi:hypothetical protein